MAIWVLTRNRPTGPRRGTSTLVLGAASVVLVAIALAFHFAIDDMSGEALVVLLVRIATLVVPLAWAALVLAGYRQDRRSGTRSYGARAGLALLIFATLGGTIAMLPGIIDAATAI